MNTYEITFIVRPDLDEEQTRAVVDGVIDRIGSNGGEILATVPWNPPRRRMAYPIRDFGDGFYITSVFRYGPQVLRAFENQLRLNDSILRFLIVQATDQMVKQAQQRVQQAVARAAAPPPSPESVEPAAVTAPETSPEADVTTSAETMPEPEPAAVSAAETPAEQPEE